MCAEPLARYTCVPTDIEVEFDHSYVSPLIFVVRFGKHRGNI